MDELRIFYSSLVRVSDLVEDISDFENLVDSELKGIENYQTIVQRWWNYVIHYWVDRLSSEFMQRKEYLGFTLP